MDNVHVCMGETFTSAINIYTAQAIQNATITVNFGRLVVPINTYTAASFSLQSANSNGVVWNANSLNANSISRIKITEKKC